MKSARGMFITLVLALAAVVTTLAHAVVENLDVVVTPSAPGVINQLGGIVPGGGTVAIDTSFTVAAADIDAANESLRVTAQLGGGPVFPLDCDPVDPAADPVQFTCHDAPATNAGLAAALLLLPPGTHAVTVTVERLVDGGVVETDTDTDATLQVVIPDIATLAEVVRRMGNTVLPGTNTRLIKNRGQVQRLLSSLRQAQRFEDRGKTDKACHHLDVFEKKVRTQAGRHIHSLAAAKLIADAEALCAQLQASP